MNAQEAIQILTERESIEAATVLTQAVEKEVCTNPAGLLEWIAQGEFDKSMTVLNIASLWDEQDDFNYMKPSGFEAWANSELDF